MERLIVEARLAETRAAPNRAALEFAIRELYGPSDEAGRAVDPALFARYIWCGLHLPGRS